VTIWQWLFQSSKANMPLDSKTKSKNIRWSFPLWILLYWS